MTTAPAQEDFFVPEWPANWATDQPMGSSFETQPGLGLLGEATPMLSNTQGIAATNDIRSLFIMTCSRLDKIETSLARIDGELVRTRDNIERTAQAGSQSKEMIDGLRKSLGIFSKTLFAYLRGDEGIDGKSVSAG
ncbi:hypothetical protein ACJZ2D_016421 [Fusarium nematophilum]